MDQTLFYWLLGLAGALISFLLIVIGAQYKREKKIEDNDKEKRCEEYEFVAEKQEEMNKIVQEGFKNINSIFNDFKINLSLQEQKLINLGESCNKMDALMQKRIDSQEIKITSISDTVAKHDFEIKLLKRRSGYKYIEIEDNDK
jgi:hypothetical protein